MAEWKTLRLGEVADLCLGKMLDAKKNKGIPRPYLNNVAVRWGQFDLEELPEMKIEEEEVERYSIVKGDIVICEGGEPGRCAVWKSDEPIFFQKALHRARVKPCCDSNFIYYQFCHLVKIGETRSFETGSTIRHLPAQELKQIPIFLPPLPTQRKIAAVLGALDDKIENNRKICANLEAQAQAIFKSWFVDFEPFGGKMPQGWKMGKLGDICSYISRGLTPKYVDSSNELILGQTCVRNNVVSLANARSHQLSKETVKKVHKLDTLINSTGIGSLGRVGIVYFDMPNVAFDSHLTVVRASDSIFNHYLGRNLLNRQSEIENMAVGSTGQTELPRDSVREMAMIIPTQPILEQFNEIIDPVGKRIYHSLLQNSRLAALRDALLPKLMSGEIDVERVKVA